MGQARAQSVLRGAPLPPLGSFQERVLTDLLLRERNEKFAFAALICQLAMVAGNIPPGVAKDLLDEYQEELYQLRYNSKYKTVKERRIAKSVAEAEEKARLLARLDRITKDE